MSRGSDPRFGNMKAILVVLLFLLPSFAFIPWVMAGADDGEATSRASSRAFDDDLAAINVASPHDLDENIGSIVPDNAIPTGTQNIQATIKNVGNNPQAGPTPVSFNFETGTETVIWTDDFESGPGSWITDGLTEDSIHWHYDDNNANGGTGYSLVSSFTSGPRAGKYGNSWEETAEMTTRYSIPTTPASEPYFQIWNFTDTQVSSDGGYVQIQIGQGPWLDIEPFNPVGPPPPPPPLGYRGSINSGTSVLSNGHGAWTGSAGWLQGEVFPLWSQNLGEVNDTNVRFRLWFTSDGSNPQDYSGWFVDDVVFFNGDSIVFSDNLDNPSSGNWEFVNQNAIDDTNGWEQLDGGGVGSSVAWWIGNFTQNKYINGTDHVLESPPIALTGTYNEARFTYWQKYNISNLDGGWVEISSDGGSNWDYVEPLFDLSPPANVETKYPGYIDENSDFGKIGGFTGEVDWEKAAFDLTPYIGQTVKVRFHFYSNWDDNLGKGWFIDNMEVKTWDFTAHGSDNTNINQLNPGNSAVAQVNYDFDTESDWRIRVTVPGDDDTTNDEWHSVIRVKNIRDFTITPAQVGGTIVTANHGDGVEFELHVTNTGNLPDDYNLSIKDVPAEWNVTLTPEDITNLRPTDDPFLVRVDLETTIDSGPTTYPTTDLQALDYILNFTGESVNEANLDSYLVVRARMTNTKPEVSFLTENINARVYTPKDFTQNLFIASDSDDDDLEYIWDWGDGSDVENTTEWPVQHIYTTSRPISNPYVVTLKVSDGLAESDTTTINVSVLNDPPTAKFVIETIPVNNTFAVGDPITFNATAPDYTKDENPDGLTFNWNFGDGNTGEGAVATHTYETGGTKIVNLTVLDEEDVIAYAETEVHINTPPTAVITSPADLEEFYLGEVIEFNASQCSDNEQTDPSQLDFLWTSNVAGELGNQQVFYKAFSSTDHIGPHTITLTVYDRKADGISYDMRTINIKAKPQNPPKLERDLDNTPVVPENGFISADVFKFSVLYKDIDNDRPTFVRVVIDPGMSNEKSYDMAQKDTTNRDYKNGVLFQTTVPGNGIGADQVHSFLFETADERNETIVIKSQTFSGPRITREKLIQNQAVNDVPAGVIFAKVRYVGRQDQNPLKLDVSSTGAAPPANTMPIGFYVTISAEVDNSLWDYANLSFKYGKREYEEAVNKINLSSVQLYKLSGGSWQVVEDATNDENGLIVSYNDMKEEGTFGLFGKEKESGGGGGGGGGDTGGIMDYLGLIILIIVIVIVVVAIAVMTRKKKARASEWGGKDGIDLKIDIISGEGTDAAAVETVEGGQAAAPTEGIEEEAGVAIYRPGGAEPEPEPEPEVPVYRPGGETTDVTEEGEAYDASAYDESSYDASADTWQPEATEEASYEEPAPAEEPAPTPEEPGKPAEKKADTEGDDLLDEILGED